MDCDYSKYPSKETQLLWIVDYLAAYEPSVSHTPSYLQSVYEEVEIFSLMSHLYWGVWALVQAQYSDIDFDYMTYATRRCRHFLDEKRRLSTLLDLYDT